MRIIVYILLYIITVLPISIIFNEDNLWLCGVICGFVVVFIAAVNEILKKLEQIIILFDNKSNYEKPIDFKEQTK